MEDNLKQQIDKLQADLDRLKEIVNSDEPKEGEWWYADCLGTKNYLVLKGQHGVYNCSCYFTPSEGLLFTNGGEVNHFTRKATDQEVCDAFKKHLEANGWTKGCKFKSAVYNNDGEYSGNLNMENENIYCNGRKIFDSDFLTLAELIKDEKIMVVGENEVLFENKGWCRINGVLFEVTEIKALLPLNPIFQKILNRLNKE